MDECFIKSFIYKIKLKRVLSPKLSIEILLAKLKLFMFSLQDFFMLATIPPRKLFMTPSSFQAHINHHHMKQEKEERLE